ncbi:MAG TPA: ROK family protein, partial [Terriglobales bacterium]|nr:ROK family protein [Terriglobales bacterium]
DLGGTNLRVAVADSQGTLLEKLTTGTQVSRGRDRVISEMCDDIRALAAKFGATGGEFAGIGVGVPGIIDMATGFLRESPNLPGWENYPVRDAIEQRLGTRVVLENDANAAAMGEKWLGAGRHADDMCMLTLGTGVGGGLILNGRVWHGMTGMAGELGHITVHPEGQKCGCGNRGCVEQYASATAVVRMARELSASGEAPELADALRENPEFSSKVVYQMALQGDEAAREIFRRVGRALGIVVAAMINIFNLPMFVVGGGVASAWDAFAPALFEEVRARSFVYAATAPSDAGKIERNRTIITRALLGSDAGLFGAARLPMLGTEANPLRDVSASAERKTA